MAETSYPHVGSPLREYEWRRVMRANVPSGIVPDVGGAAEVTDGGGLISTVATADALVNGFLWEGTSATDVTHDVGGANNRVDLIVVRYDPDPAGDGTEPGEARLAILKGIEDGTETVPTPTQDDADVWELPLAERTVAAGSAVAGAIVDRRQYVPPVGPLSSWPPADGDGFFYDAASGLYVPGPLTGPKVAAGTYTGDGTSARTIALAFDPAWVVVHARGAGGAWRWSAILTQNSYGVWVETTTWSNTTNDDVRPDLTTAGFIVSGSGGNHLNANGTVYEYIAFGAS